MFSRSTGAPFSTPEPMTWSVDFWPSRHVLRPLASSCFLIHFMPCSCGSIMSGQRAQFVTIAPFWIETLSAGSVSLFHDAISASLVRTLSGSAASDMGRANAFLMVVKDAPAALPCMYGTKTPLIRSNRKRLLKQPMYDTKADARRTSPTRRPISWLRSSMPCFQRAPSDESALMRRWARPSLRSHMSASAITSSFSLTAALNCAVSSATVASASAFAASAASLAAMAFSSVSVASSAFRRIGSTFSLMFQ
mmetsp:Transcript_13836/g.40703  ORF Transcript_13836/g.40703 Transcript_13836/m.40703 type:complete len:251 (-) Transcript_13836:4520-5272(-)